jgi:heat shock protein HtpX
MLTSIDPARQRVMMMLVALVAVPTLLLGVIGVVVGVVWLGLVIGFVLGAATVWWVHHGGERRVLRLVGAHEADDERYRRYHNVVDGLCVSAGVPKPALWVIDDPAANAIALGPIPTDASLVVTTGLLDQLPRIELEGVIAALLGQIRSGDTRLNGVVASVATLVAPLGGLSDSVTGRFVERERITRTDVTACRITRYPPGMIAALQRLADHDTEPAVRPRAVAHCWLIPGNGPHDLPTLDERISMLREL